MNNNELIRSLLAARPCGLLTDIDGTISPIASTPDSARVSATAQQHLQALVQQLDMVGAISGRSATDAAAMVAIPQMMYIGNHGMEIWQQGVAQPVPEAQPFIQAIDAVLHAAEEQLSLPGVLFENKGVTASVHYRLTPDPDKAKAEVEAVLRPLSVQYSLQLTEGRLVWELRPPIEINKGTAIQRLVEQYGLKGVMFLGDDRTDADAFKVLHELRAQGVCTTLNVGVTAAETPSVVRELADVLVDGVPGVEQFLAEVVALATNDDNLPA